jgi:uncharacterized membrane protein
MFFAFFSLVFLVGCLALLVRVERLSARVAALQSRLERFEREQSALRGIEPHGAAAAPVAPLAGPMAERQHSPVAPAAARGTAHQPTRESTSPPPPPALRPSRSKEEWEALIGGKLLNRIGALALFIGVGLFLKYAFDNNWITETFRVLIGAAVGAGSLILAARTQKKGFAVFAQGLVGAGLAILYLSVYASFNYYHLLPQIPAFLLMAAVTVLAFTHALRYDSLAVSLIGWLGGFLTPFLLSTGEDNQIGLFTYLLLLDAGVIIVLQKKRVWSILEPLTIAGTYVIYYTWYGEYYSDTLLASTIAFVGLFWFLFHGLDLFLVFRSPEPTSPLRRLLAWMNAFLAFWAIVLPTGRSDKTSLTVVLVVFAFLYAMSALAVRRRKPGEQSAAVHYALASIIILAAALGNEFERFALPMAWAAETVLVMLLARQITSRPLALAGEALLTIAFLKLLATHGAIWYDPLSLYAPVWNDRFLAFVVLLGAAAGSAFLLKRMDRPGEAEAFHYGWMVILLITLSAEINDIFRALAVDAPEVLAEAAGFQRTMTLIVGWTIVGLTFLACAGRGLVRPLLFAGSSVLLVAFALGGICGITFAPQELFTPILNVRFAALLFVAAGGLLAVRILKNLRISNPWAEEFRFAVQIVVAILCAILLTGEIRDGFEKLIALTREEYRTSDDLIRLENLKQLSLSGGWLLYSIGLMGIGLWRRIRALRILAIGLFACTILKIFIYDLSFLETLYRFISFIALGVILLMVSYLYQRYRAIVFEPSRE